MLLQGGAINCGLFIAGPLPTPLGGCEGQDEKNPLGCGPSEDVNGGWGWAVIQPPWRSLAAN